MKPAGLPARRALAALALALLLGSLAPAAPAARPSAVDAAAPAGAPAPTSPCLAGILLSPRTRLIIDFQRTALA